MKKLENDQLVIFKSGKVTIADIKVFEEKLGKVI